MRQGRPCVAFLTPGKAGKGLGEAILKGMPPPLAVFPLAAVPGCRFPDGRRYGAPRRSVRGGKSASGGLRSYTGVSVFEKRCGTRESAPCGWEVRWGAALTQTGNGDAAVIPPGTGSTSSSPANEAKTPTNGDEAAKNALTEDKKPKVFTGDATLYNLPGNPLAYGGTFDPYKMAAAMTPEKAHKGQVVTVEYTTTGADGTTTTTKISVVVNDTGPWLRGADGKAVLPRTPDPRGAIDLTPTAFKALTGGTRFGRVPVTVTVP